MVRVLCVIIRLNPAQTNIIIIPRVITVGIAFSPSPVQEKNDSRALIVASGAFTLTSVMVPSCDCSIVLPREIP